MKTQTTQQRFYVRWFRRICKSLLVLFFVYLLVLLVGLIPVNNDFEPTNDGITVYVVSNAVHAEVIVPKTTDVVDWADRFSQVGFRGPVEDKTHVAFGWGDRGFFLETPTWDDFKVSVAAKALFVPSGSCMPFLLPSPKAIQTPLPLRSAKSNTGSLSNSLTIRLCATPQEPRSRLRGTPIRPTMRFSRPKAVTIF